MRSWARNGQYITAMVAVLALLVVSLVAVDDTGPPARAQTGAIELGAGVRIEPHGAADGVHPALVLPLGSDIRPGRNVQGQPGSFDIACGHRDLRCRLSFCWDLRCWSVFYDQGTRRAILGVGVHHRTEFYGRRPVWCPRRHRCYRLEVGHATH